MSHKQSRTFLKKLPYAVNTVTAAETKKPVLAEQELHQPMCAAKINESRRYESNGLKFPANLGNRSLISVVVW